MMKVLFVAAALCCPCVLGATPELLAQAKKLGRSTDEWRVEDWTSTEESVPHKELGTVKKTTYVSPTIKLMKGGSHFTWDPLTDIPFPKGNYSVLEVDFDIVDADGAEVPLTEVYIHHWLVGSTGNANPLHLCDDNMVSDSQRSKTSNSFIPMPTHPPVLRGRSRDARNEIDLLERLWCTAHQLKWSLWGQHPLDSYRRPCNQLEGKICRWPQ